MYSRRPVENIRLQKRRELLPCPCDGGTDGGGDKAIAQRTGHLHAEKHLLLLDFLHDFDRRVQHSECVLPLELLTPLLLKFVTGIVHAIEVAVPLNRSCSTALDIIKPADRRVAKAFALKLAALYRNLVTPVKQHATGIVEQMFVCIHAQIQDLDNEIEDNGNVQTTHDNNEQRWFFSIDPRGSRQRSYASESNQQLVHALFHFESLGLDVLDHPFSHEPEQHYAFLACEIKCCPAGEQIRQLVKFPRLCQHTVVGLREVL
mmetsp:Transcript_8902/g.23662  ORF Transcript_8902/g.23662 Transcript_8902/m.23662 type:complete len:261 (+) Transcript_8902:37-819(+)